MILLKIIKVILAWHRCRFKKFDGVNFIDIKINPHKFDKKSIKKKLPYLTIRFTSYTIIKDVFH